MHMYAKLKPNNLKESSTSLKDRLVNSKGGGNNVETARSVPKPSVAYQRKRTEMLRNVGYTLRIRTTK
jgi:hypothetical protein